MKQITLCGRPGGCCPDVCIDEENVFIIDDKDGGAVQITREQFDILKDKIKAGEI